MSTRQLNFDFLGEISKEHSEKINSAISALANSQEIETRGAIFTRPEVVNFILDLIGYTKENRLYEKRILEPSFGDGDFLLLAIQRLMHSWRTHKDAHPTFDDLRDSIRAVELHWDTYISTCNAVVLLLKREGLSDEMSRALVDHWLIQGDFLLAPLDGQFDFVVGNPPYVRQELIPPLLLSEYKKLYSTIYDRADIYIPFIERSLTALEKYGSLGFICSDRWMKNRYGGPLRNLVSEKYHLKIYVDMVNTSPFRSDVMAYPAIIVINRDTPAATRIAYRPEVEEEVLAKLSKELLVKSLPKEFASVREMTKVTRGSEPWLFGSYGETSLIRNLEQRFPKLEEAGCKVGIGVATGADKAFIGNFDSLDVEFDRKIPLVTTKDIATGEVRWQGKGVVNPFSDGGELVDLQAYPKLRTYLEERKGIIASRHCARKSPNNWYRTIDRITPMLASTPKLLIPDIKGEAHVVFEDGRFYPHHNLYYVTSRDWDLRALKAVLFSSVARLFVSNYSIKMRGDFFRFQAQYLRRICIPFWKDVPEHLRQSLIEAAIKHDVGACNHAVNNLYGFSQAEITTLSADGG